MVRFHDPRGEVRTAMEPYELSRDIRRTGAPAQRWR